MNNMFENRNKKYLKQCTYKDLVGSHIFYEHMYSVLVHCLTDLLSCIMEELSILSYVSKA